MTPIKADLDGNHLSIKIAGHFTFQLYKEFSAAYKQFMDKPQSVDVDLRAVEYIDSAALGIGHAAFDAQSLWGRHETLPL